jgi:hypothetical protein
MSDKLEAIGRKQSWSNRVTVLALPRGTVENYRNPCQESWYLCSVLKQTPLEYE